MYFAVFFMILQNYQVDVDDEFVRFFDFALFAFFAFHLDMFDMPSGKGWRPAADAVSCIECRATASSCCRKRIRDRRAIGCWHISLLDLKIHARLTIKIRAIEDPRCFKNRALFFARYQSWAPSQKSRIALFPFSKITMYHRKRVHKKKSVVVCPQRLRLSFYDSADFVTALSNSQVNNNVLPVAVECFERPQLHAWLLPMNQLVNSLLENLRKPISLKL